MLRNRSWILAWRSCKQLFPFLLQLFQIRQIRNSDIRLKNLSWGFEISPFERLAISGRDVVGVALRRLALHDILGKLRIIVEPHGFANFSTMLEAELVQRIYVVLQALGLQPRAKLAR